MSTESVLREGPRPFKPGELHGITLSVQAGPIDLRPGASARIRVSIANNSKIKIGTFRFWNPYAVVLGYAWVDKNTGNILPHEGELSDIWLPLSPGDHRVIRTHVRAPATPGSYSIWIMLHQRGVRWYDSTSEVQPVRVDVEVREDAPLLPESINAFEDSIFSQNGEDGILRELFLRIGCDRRFLVEFGVGDGMECNGAYWLRQYGWHGLLIEGDPDRFQGLQRNYKSYDGVSAANAYVTAENIVGIFEAHNVPREFDLLSIDIDGNDYWLWQALAYYRPRVIVIEFNRSIAPPRLWVMAYNPNHMYNPSQTRNYYGASLESLTRLGLRLGYSLIGTDLNDVNAVFVRNDLLALSKFPERSPAEAVHFEEHRFPPGWEPRYGDGPYLEQ